MSLIKLSIIVIGAGIGGLTAATFLAQDGHQVTVLERQAKEYQSRGTGGIALFHNSKTLWKQRGLLDRILDIADSGSVTQNLSYKGTLIGETRAPEPHTFVHREDLLQVLLNLVAENKVDLRFDSTIESIHDAPDMPSVKLVSGEEMQADLIVAADGIRSFVRRQLYPDVEPQMTSSVVALVDVPKEKMLETEGTKHLWEQEPYQHTYGPERDIVFWSMRKHDPHMTHLQFCDHTYDASTGWYGEDTPDGPLVTTIDDLSSMRKRWEDFEPRVQHILQSAESYTRWKIAEVPAIPSYSSPNHGFVLLGDSAHAVMPFAGQGANMSIEDAACLASMLGMIESKQEIPAVLRVYDELRVPRLAGLREIIARNRETFSAKDGSQAQKERDQRLVKGRLEQAVPEELASTAETKGSQKDWTRYGTKEMWVWLVGYDMIAETEKAWTARKSTAEVEHKL